MISLIILNSLKSKILFLSTNKDYQYICGVPISLGSPHISQNGNYVLG